MLNRNAQNVFRAISLAKGPLTMGRGPVGASGPFFTGPAGANGPAGPHMMPMQRADGGIVSDQGVTIPEPPHALAHQRQALIDGRKAAVLYPHNGGPPPEPPPGAGVVSTDDGVFHYNPKLISAEHIVHAAANNRLNDVLGLGPYSKDDILDRVLKGEMPVGVVVRDHNGHEVVSAVGTPSTAGEQAHAMQHQIPESGSISVEPAMRVIMERIEHQKAIARAKMVADSLGKRRCYTSHTASKMWYER